MVRDRFVERRPVRAGVLRHDPRQELLLPSPPTTRARRLLRDATEREDAGGRVPLSLVREMHATMMVRRLGPVRVTKRR